MPGVEVLQRRQLQSLFIYRLSQGSQLVISPNNAARGLAPYVVAAGSGHIARPKIIRQVRDDMCRPCLFGKPIMVAIQHVPI